MLLVHGKKWPPETSDRVFYGLFATHYNRFLGFSKLAVIILLVGLKNISFSSVHTWAPRPVRKCHYPGGFQREGRQWLFKLMHITILQFGSNGPKKVTGRERDLFVSQRVKWGTFFTNSERKKRKKRKSKKVFNYVVRSFISHALNGPQSQRWGWVISDFVTALSSAGKDLSPVFVWSPCLKDGILN